MSRVMIKDKENRLLLAAPLSFLRRNLAFLLQREGLDLMVASDGREALHLAREHRPSVIIADVELPGISGFGVCQCVKEDPELSHLPVMLYSQELPVDFRDKAWASGAYDVLRLPFEANDILEKVSHAILGLPTVSQAVVVSQPGASEELRSTVVGVFEGRRLILAPPSGLVEDAARRFPRNTRATFTFTDGAYTATQWLGSVRKVEEDGVEVYLDKLVAREQRRQSVRRIVSVPARYKLPGDFYRLADVVNLSVDGMRLAQLRGHLSVGLTVDFALTLNGRKVNLQGEVRWLKQSRPGEFDCGVSLVNLDDESRDVLYHYLFSNPPENDDEPKRRLDGVAPLWRQLEVVMREAASAPADDGVAGNVMKQFQSTVCLLNGMTALIEDHPGTLDDPSATSLRGLVEQVIREIDQMQGQSTRLKNFFRQALGA